MNSKLKCIFDIPAEAVKVSNHILFNMYIYYLKCINYMKILEVLFNGYNDTFYLIDTFSISYWFKCHPLLSV